MVVQFAQLSVGVRFLAKEATQVEMPLQIHAGVACRFCSCFITGQFKMQFDL